MKIEKKTVLPKMRKTGQFRYTVTDIVAHDFKESKNVGFFVIFSCEHGYVSELYSLSKNHSLETLVWAAKLTDEQCAEFVPKMLRGKTVLIDGELVRKDTGETYYKIVNLLQDNTAPADDGDLLS